MNYLNLIPIVLLAVIIITLLIENKKLKNAIKAKDEAYEVAMKTIKQYQKSNCRFTIDGKPVDEVVKLWAKRSFPDAVIIGPINVTIE